MTEIITIFCMLICLYAVNPTAADFNAYKGVFAESRASRVESVIGSLGKLAPEILVTADSSAEVPLISNPAVPATESTPEPGQSSPAPENTPLPGQSTPAPESTPAPVQSMPAPESTPLPVQSTPVPEKTPTSGQSTPAAEKPPTAVIDPAKLNYKVELTNLGFYKEESKDTDLNLRNAVLRFQSSCNLALSGKWDDKCLKTLVKLLSADNTTCEDIIKSPASEGMWIAVNKTKRILTLYEGINVLKKYPVAIGNPSTLTPDGKFKIISKVINPAWGGGGYAPPVKGGIPANPLGYRWLGLSYKGGDDLGIHGNNSPYSIGKNISHGCIRMINTDVEELFEVVPRTADVWIGTDAVLKQWGIEQKE